MKISDAKILGDWLSTPQKIVITTHQKPDADALGSSLGLYNYLKKKGHDAVVISPTDYPDFLFWMEANDTVEIFTPAQNRDWVEDKINQSDIIFCLDFSSLDRINEMGEMVRKSPAKKVLIDHHLEPEEFADFHRWSTQAAATCELVYELIVDLGDKNLVDRGIAECLYAGIMTDTGNFRHPNVTVNIFRICAELIEAGARSSKVSHLIYDNSSLDRLRLLGFCLKEKLTVLKDQKTAYMALSSQELKSFNAKTGDTEGLVNYALSIKGVKVAALFKEGEKIIKMSFRSEGDYSVNKLAKKYFNGGGHKNAAGGQSQDTLDDTVKQFLAVLPEFLETKGIDQPV